MRLQIYITCTCVHLFYSASRSLNRVIFFRYKLKFFDLLFECKSHFVENIYTPQMNFLSVIDDKQYYFFFHKESAYCICRRICKKNTWARVCRVEQKRRTRRRLKRVQNSLEKRRGCFAVRLHFFLQKCGLCFFPNCIANEVACVVTKFILDV